MEHFPTKVSLVPEQELKEAALPPRFTVRRIVHEGLAFGEGQISGQEEDPKLLSLLDDTIHNSPAILIPVETEDDGCSDGRETVQVFTAETVFKRGLNRAKVFGGAVAMKAAAAIGLGQAHGKSLQEVFNDSVDTLQEKKINFGAHTDEKAHGSDSGCGAIDRAPEALVAILKHEDRIRSVVASLAEDTSGLDEVYNNFRTYVRETQAQPDQYSGSSVLERILSAGKVIKRLGGGHRERRIVLNNIRGYTVNQRLIRLVTGGRAQVFAADIWRLKDIAAKSYPEQPHLQNQAFLSELVYTLGVAAVLTKGDLPVDLIEAEAV